MCVMMDVYSRERILYLTELVVFVVEESGCRDEGYCEVQG